MACATQEQERSFALLESARERGTIAEGHGSDNNEGGVGRKEQHMVDRVGQRFGDSRLKRLRENRSTFAEVYDGELIGEQTQLSFDDAKARSPHVCGLVCCLCWSPSTHCRGDRSSDIVSCEVTRHDKIAVERQGIERYTTSKTGSRRARTALNF
jgi:hypothetical protein